MRKTLLLAVGAFALIASMAMAQAAVASHETVQSTTALKGSVVPAYTECPATGGGGFHAAPVSFPSCTTGLATRDVSPLLKPKPYAGTGGGFTSSFNVQVVQPSPTVPNWNPSGDVIDVKVDNTNSGTLCEAPNLFLSAVRQAACPNPTNTGVCTTAGASPFCPYSGRIIGESTIRVTDQDNCSTAVCDNGTLHGTVRDFDFSFVIQCSAGNCNVNTTADAQFGTSWLASADPTVLNKRAGIEIHGVRAQDPGPNNQAGSGCPLSCGDGDEKDAAFQGVFIK